MKKLINWLKASNRYKHLIGGFLVSIVTLCPVYAIYVGIVAASCLEFKDIQWGGKWDWTDWVMTMVGSVVAAVLTCLLCL